MLRKYAAGSKAGSGALGKGISGTEMIVLDMGDIPPYFGKTADFGVLPGGLVGDSEVLIIDGFESLRLKMPMLKTFYEDMTMSSEERHMQSTRTSEEQQTIDDNEQPELNKAK